MIEPVSSIGAVAGISKAAFGVVTGLWGFVADNRTVNEKIRMLRDEAQALGRISEGLENLLRSPELAPYQDPELWNEANAALDGCKVPLDELERVVNKLRPSNSKSERWTAGDALRVLKKYLNDDDFDRLRTQLHSHNLVLVGIQGRMGVLVSTRGLSDVSRILEEMRLEVRTNSQLVAGLAREDERSREAQARTETIPPQLALDEGLSSNVTFSIQTPLRRSRTKKYEPTAWAKKKASALAQPKQWAEFHDCISADIPAVLDANYTELHWATLAGDLEEVKYFLKNGHTINEIGPGTSHNLGRTALHIVSLDENVKIASWLISQGADVSATASRLYRERSPLHVAVLTDSVDLVALLLSGGADTDAKDTKGWTPLSYACKDNQMEVIKLLVSKNAKVNSVTNMGNSPLCIASQNGEAKVAEYLIANDATVDLKNNSGESPLIFASWWGHISVVKILISKGANVNSTDRDGYTPLHCAAQYDHTQLVEYLLSKGAKVHSKTVTDRTALHVAAKGNSIESMRILLDQHADFNMQDKYGHTPLVTACYCGHIESARWLLEKGAKIDNLAVRLAAEKDHTEIVKLLFEYGAKPKEAIKSSSNEEVRKKIKQAHKEYLDE